MSSLVYILSVIKNYSLVKKNSFEIVFCRNSIRHTLGSEIASILLCNICIVYESYGLVLIMYTPDSLLMFTFMRSATRMHKKKQGKKGWGLAEKADLYSVLFRNLLNREVKHLKTRRTRFFRFFWFFCWFFSTKCTCFTPRIEQNSSYSFNIFSILSTLITYNNNIVASC